MKKKSFIRRTVILLTVQLILLVMMLAAYISVSYFNMREGMRQSEENFVSMYGRELDNKLESADRVLEQLVYDNQQFALLQSDRESERYYASIRLLQQIQDIAASNRFADFIVAAEAKYGNALIVANGPLLESKKSAIRNASLEAAAENRMKAQWTVRMIADEAYVCKTYVWQDTMAGVFMSVESFLKMSGGNEFANMSIFLADREQRIWGAYGSAKLDWERGEALPESAVRYMLRSEYPLLADSLVVYTYMDINNFSEQITGSMLVLLGICFVSLFFGIFLINSIRRDILAPMRDMRENMLQIQQGDYLNRMEGNDSSMEFEMLKSSFNKLMDEIIGLKIHDYERQIELQESELRSIRLQIRPHFFQNAMTTISSLSIQGKNDEIKKYIDALSKNIRYMFKSGMHTVPLSEEIRHVENYFEMQELKYPGCVFYYISTEPGAKEWRIPQMLLHTIIENEYKYAVSVDSMLSILIKIYQIEELLCIEIEDDGAGYPAEVLEQFAKHTARPDPDGYRVGLWSVRKMLELMYEREGLFEISNIEPHGCLNRFLIPAKPVCEVTQEPMQSLE